MRFTERAMGWFLGEVDARRRERNRLRPDEVRTLTDLKSFIDAGGLKRHPRLDLAARSWDGRAFADAIVFHPDAAALRKLVLAEDRIESAGLRRFANSTALGELEILDLHGNPLGDEGGGLLAASRCLAPRTLDLSGTGIGDRGISALADSVVFSRVESLRLSGNRIGASGLQTLLGRCPSLRFLDLAHNPLGDAGARVVADAEGARRLEHLDLARTELTTEGLWALASAQALPALSQLSLQRNHLAPVSARALAAGCWQKLERLVLSQNPIGDEGAEALAASANLTALTELNLTRTGIGDSGAQALARGSWPRLRALFLGNNGIGEAGAAALQAGARSLERLVLFGNPFDSAGQPDPLGREHPLGSDLPRVAGASGRAHQQRSPSERRRQHAGSAGSD